MSIVGLLTDFGHEDWFVAAMKGVIKVYAPEAKVVDITHEIPRHNVREAAYQLASVFHDFPPRTVYIVVVDPGVGSDRAAIAGEIDGRYVVGPDNGFVSWCLVHARFARFVSLDRPEFFGRELSRTFHGRDIFAPVGAHLARGRRLEELGSPWPRPQLLRTPMPRIESDGKKLVGEVVHVDRFGNLITNLPNLVHGKGRVVIQDREPRAAQTYSEGKGKELIVVPGSCGTLEIAVREDSAAAALGADVGEDVVVYLHP